MATLAFMDAQDAYFTHTIVGAPFSMLLGRRMSPELAQLQGVEIEPEQGEARLHPAWQAWAIDHAHDWPAGTPRPRSRGLRRWLERHGLGLALLGLLGLSAGVGVLAWVLAGMPRWPL